MQRVINSITVTMPDSMQAAMLRGIGRVTVAWVDHSQSLAWGSADPRERKMRERSRRIA
jgi:hypothetical protein